MSVNVTIDRDLADELTEHMNREGFDKENLSTKVRVALRRYMKEEKVK